MCVHALVLHTFSPCQPTVTTDNTALSGRCRPHHRCMTVTSTICRDPHVRSVLALTGNEADDAMVGRHFVVAGAARVIYQPVKLSAAAYRRYSAIMHASAQHGTCRFSGFSSRFINAGTSPEVGRHTQMAVTRADKAPVISRVPHVA